MNSIAMDKAVQKAVQRRFRSQTTMLPRAVHYPQNLEREYARLIDAYMLILSKAFAEHLPTIRHAMTETRAGMQHDDYNEFGELMYSINVDLVKPLDVIMNIFMRVQRDFERRAMAFNFEGKISTLANQSRRFTVTQWRRFVHDALGVNILEDYYNMALPTKPYT